MAGGVNAMLWSGLTSGICQLRVCLGICAVLRASAWSLLNSHACVAECSSNSASSSRPPGDVRCCRQQQPAWPLTCSAGCASLLSVFIWSQALSQVGRCRTFEASADGYGRGEGFAAMVLCTDRLNQPGLEHSPLAAVHSSAVNQDGRSSSLTAPNGPAQTVCTSSSLASTP